MYEHPPPPRQATVPCAALGARVVTSSVSLSTSTSFVHMFRDAMWSSEDERELVVVRRRLLVRRHHRDADVAHVGSALAARRRRA
jgi:hypothetical protein